MQPILFGEAAMAANTTGSDNTAIGRNALQNITSGSQNTALGLGLAQLIRRELEIYSLDIWLDHKKPDQINFT